MSRFTQPSQDDGGYILVARMDNAKSLHSILKAVNFREVRNSRECDDTKFGLGHLWLGVHAYK